MFQQRGKTTFIETHWKKKLCSFQQRPLNREYAVDPPPKVRHLIKKFKRQMANKLSVMNVIRNVVSKQRIRYKENGYNLDLAYISANIIAMGYPADNLEGFYRNRSEDVYKFLEESHAGHYKIYNLCLERSYDKNKFHGRVSVYPFEDHNPPPIELIQEFCNDVGNWLRQDEGNVAAVHCKAGKGRTGTMICCYLLYSGQFDTAEDALTYYDEKRTKDRKGVTIPSQRRYVQYFSKLLRSNVPYEKRTLQLCEIRFTDCHALHNHGSVHCSVSVLQDTAGSVEILRNMCMDFRKSFTLDLRNPYLEVTGDIKFEMSAKTPKKKIFHFWFNTYFVCDVSAIEGEGDNARYVYTLSKHEIDDVHKDKDHKVYPEDFKVQLVFLVHATFNRNSQISSKAQGNHRISSGNVINRDAYTYMGARNFSAHNSHPPTTAVTPSEIAMQHNNSGGDLSTYQCDQRSSSSSTSASILVGNELNNIVDRSKRTSNHNAAAPILAAATSANSESKMHPLSFPPKNMQRNTGSLFNEVVSEVTFMQAVIADYNSVTPIKQKNLHHQHQQELQLQQQQQHQQYQPSDSRVVVPPSKVSKGNSSSNSSTTQSNNHNTKSTTTANNHISFGDSSSKNSNLAKSVPAKNNGVHHSMEESSNDSIEDDEAEEEEEEEEEEDWESVNTSQTPTTTAIKMNSSFEGLNNGSSGKNGINGDPGNSSLIPNTNNNIASKQQQQQLAVVCDAANYVLLSSSKSHPYKKRAHNGSTRLDADSNAGMVAMPNAISNNKAAAPAHAHPGVIAKNLKPRPRRETT